MLHTVTSSASSMVASQVFADSGVRRVTANTNARGRAQPVWWGREVMVLLERLEAEGSIADRSERHFLEQLQSKNGTEEQCRIVKGVRHRSTFEFYVLLPASCCRETLPDHWFERFGSRDQTPLMFGAILKEPVPIVCMIFALQFLVLVNHSCKSVSALLASSSKATKNGQPNSMQNRTDNKVGANCIQDYNPLKTILS